MPRCASYRTLLSTSSISSSTVSTCDHHRSVFKEKDEFFTRIGSLHEEFYKKVLAVSNEKEGFLDSMNREKVSGSSSNKEDKVLDTKPQSHFGEAFKRLQSLFFMLRENEDVF